MWLMTTRGFFSAVQHREDPTRILVRARCEEDIRNLADLIDAEPWALMRSDYEWRLECSAAEWMTAVAKLALEIDYDNFKNAVKEAQGQKRANVYMRVWGALLDLEPQRLKKWTGGKLFRPTQLCDCWYGADAGGVLDHDIDCPYALEVEAGA